LDLDAELDRGAAVVVTTSTLARKITFCEEVRQTLPRNVSFT
jgi:hypothetical protein